MTGLRVSMDIGGTFTDVVVYDERTGRYRAGKASTTPHDLTEGVMTALTSVLAGSDGPPASPADVSFLVHGTTQGLNAFLQRRGVRVLLLAGQDAADTYHIARGPRTRLYDLHYRKPEPLVPLRDIVPVGGRLDAAGREIEPLDEDAVREAARRYRAEGFEAIAVGLLFSHANPAHELRAAEILRAELGEDVTISLSHQAANEWREYERTSSAVLEAYIGPVVRRYLTSLTGVLADHRVAVPLHVMQSSGGVITAETARHRPLQTLLSGPVGGTMGGVALARALGRDNLICVDMGGTSFDVSLVVDGRPDVTSEARLEGLPVLMSVVDIHTIGAGGGSLAWEEAGGLRVGPGSAGAAPGPACYGRGGTEATVTDANLLLGRIDERGFAGGEFDLDAAAAEQALSALGKRLGLDAVGMAEGVCEVANAKMAQAIRTITVARGIEPREFTLVAFGGAGPMHSVFLARELGIPEVVVPRFPGAFSAWGMLETEIRRDFAEPFFRLDADVDPRDMADRLSTAARTALDALDSEGVPRDRRRTECAVDIRYAAQEYTLTVPLTGPDEPLLADFPEIIAERFARQHHTRYGHSNKGAPLEFVALRVTALGALDGAPAETVPDAEADFPHRTRGVVFDGAEYPARIVERDALRRGHEFSGPAIVQEPTATTVVPPGYRVGLDAGGSLVIREEAK
ncbi:hydantoinase/oxoprolinase family protein [Streptomyces alkaliterrae]|uniref:Hydantoinase/oxoprolinase family protein n=1 Tax=Streptomyces alkaliterrae TaxID=2213162 RepID=A0A5P0YUU2_9ACTN|nr:hydantoinase/oxoprolinase family protein [Streptomyces alkaliterrae]MBB1261162.1 hydantoinase/oxoprolinase family protein [Streptomyces alkaliterrae]MQS03242.1 hydantoinase/oxoprolinase family protein [Streptomyces alkaliterrae]